MENNFIPQAVEIVKQAIDADNASDYEKAFNLYKKSLDYFMLGIKYEQNPNSRKKILERVDGYMKRAEELKDVIKNPPSNQGGGGSATISKSNQKDKENKDDDENSKLKGSLASSIVSEKPNVKWDDVAGLEMAKEALKEGIIKIYLSMY